MAEALTRTPIGDMLTPVLVDITASGTSLVFHFSDNTTHTEDMVLLLDQLLQSVDNTVVAALNSIVSTSSVLNPPTGTEKIGDVKVTANAAFMYVNSSWLQLWPII